MSKKLTLTIAIPAHNEEGNIASELTMLLAQKQSNYILDQILIFSDGSTDNTVNIIKAIDSPLVRVIKSNTRVGKPVGVNKLFSLSKSDLILLLDADLKITSKSSVSALVAPFYKYKDLGLTSGLALHSPPSSFVERLAYASNAIWEQAITYPSHNEMYYCSGSIRVFSKALSRQIKFANYSADDAYAYIACKKLGYSFAMVDRVSIIQKLPSNMRDLVSQSTRFIKSEEIQSKLFETSDVKKYFVVTGIHKLRAFFWYLPKDMIATLGYLVFRIIIAIVNIFMPASNSSLWQIATSTKRRI